MPSPVLSKSPASVAAIRPSVTELVRARRVPCWIVPPFSSNAVHVRVAPFRSRAPPVSTTTRVASGVPSAAGPASVSCPSRTVSVPSTATVFVTVSDAEPCETRFSAPSIR